MEAQVPARGDFSSVEMLDREQIVAVVLPENHASQKVLSKLGFQYVQDAFHYGFDVQYWRVQRPDFQPSDAF
jgi:hypothetical protein